MRRSRPCGKVFSFGAFCVRHLSCGFAPTRSIPGLPGQPRASRGPGSRFWRRLSGQRRESALRSQQAGRGPKRASTVSRRSTTVRPGGERGELPHFGGRLNDCRSLRPGAPSGSVEGLVPRLPLKWTRRTGLGPGPRPDYSVGRGADGRGPKKCRIEHMPNIWKTYAEHMKDIWKQRVEFGC